MVLGVLAIYPRKSKYSSTECILVKHYEKVKKSLSPTVVSQGRSVFTHDGSAMRTDVNELTTT